MFRNRLQAAANAVLSEMQLDRLAVLALLHDVGKANLGFQDKPFNPKAPRIGHVRELNPLFSNPDLTHRFAQSLMLDTLATWIAPREALEQLLLATWSHHGAPVHFDPAERTAANPCWWQPKDHRDPFAAIAGLLDAAQHAFPAAFEAASPPIGVPPALQHRFAGLVMLADWLGSHTAFFPIARPKDFDSRDAAKSAVAAVGLDARSAQSCLSSRPVGFAERFGFAPRPLQAAIDDLPVDAAQTRLLIAESETGSGKTEAALARFFHLFAAEEVDALYFALPTRVAARELYGRVCGYVERVFPGRNRRPAVLLAVPGYARVDRETVERLLPEESPWAEGVIGRRWAAEHPKRFLAATVAVGTVDQALLSALQTRHAHLRSVCLDRSLLVVDEVHASDPYMRRLLAGLLTHHIRLGGHALLLSATLGARARSELLGAAGVMSNEPPSLVEATAAPYPSLTDMDGVPSEVGKIAGPAKSVEFVLHDWLDQPEAALPAIVEALTAGARVLVVLNTVDRALTLQRAAEADPSIPTEALFRCADVICPHHGRFAPADRELLDQSVTRQWGGNSSSRPLLLIGTQTLEQSLDIDADLLITDLCPADVLLQRVGRLHRHTRQRPTGYERARCLILVPDCGNLEALLDSKGDPSRPAKAAGLGSVYPDLRALELTRRLLIDTPQVAIPADNRRLVEGATHPECLRQLAGERWQRHAQKVDGGILAQEIAAHYAAARYEQEFEKCVFNDIQKNPKARTRLGIDTLRVPLPEPLPGPFGRTVDELTVPGRFLPERSGDETPSAIECRPDGIRFTLAGVQFRYTRLGLEKNDDESAH